MQKPGTARKEYLDLLRIIAILFVLFNHTGIFGFQLFSVSRDSILFEFYLFCAVICKTAVPIFLMISGALLLRKEEPFSVILKKRFLKYLTVLFVASFVMDLYYKNWDLTVFSISDFLKTVYSRNITITHWYLYAYLGFLLTLPLLRKMSGSMKANDYCYLTCLMMIPAILKCLELFCLNYEVHYNTDFSIFSTLIIVYYPLMGDFLANKLPDEKLTARNTLLWGAVGLVFIIVNSWLTCVWCERFGEWEGQNEAFLSSFIFFPAVAIFAALRFLFLKVQFSDQIRKYIAYLGSCTFGIYLFDEIFRYSTFVVYEKLSLYTPEFVACVVWVFVAFLMGVLWISLAKKIPILKFFV